MADNVLTQTRPRGESRNLFRMPGNSPTSSSTISIPNGCLDSDSNSSRVPECIDWVVADWIEKTPTRSSRTVIAISFSCFRSTSSFALCFARRSCENVKPSHQIDLAYLYYLPFCSVFTSRDNFHAQVRAVVPGAEPRVRQRHRSEKKTWARLHETLFTITGRRTKEGPLQIRASSPGRRHISYDQALE